MPIPKIIHQTWKNDSVPTMWQGYQKTVIDLHPDWEYKLWTDADNDDFVKKNYPDFYSIYLAFPKNIMRADVIRYLIMHTMGGLYLDLDYEMLKPFDMLDAAVVLPKNRSIIYGDSFNGIGNCIFASEAGHPFWQAVLDDLQQHPPHITNYLEVLDTTGPAFLTRIFESGKYPNISMPERLVFHPPTPKKRSDYESIISNGISYGIHHCSGTWRENFSLKRSLKKLFGYGA